MTRSQLPAIVLVLATCSSPPRQTEESSASTSPAPARPAPAAPAAPAPQGSADPWQAKPADPAAELALLRADLDIICGAAKATGGKTAVEVGPYIAEHMKTAFKVELFADIRTTTLDELVERIRKGMAKVNVKQCDTVDVLIANDPRKH